MRHYAALALALTLATPAHSEVTLSKDEQWSVYALVASRYINVNCPNLYSKRAVLRQFMQGRGVSPDDFERRFEGAIRSARAVLDHDLGNDKKKMCVHFAQFYGPQGKFPGIIVTKTKP